MAEFQVADHNYEKVRPRETTNLGDRVSKKAERIKIGGHIEYEYPIEAVMLSVRGDKSEHSNARVKGSRDYTPAGVPISTGPSRGASAGGVNSDGDF